MKTLAKLQALRDLSVLTLKSEHTFFSEGKFWTVRSIPLNKKLNLLKAGWDDLTHREICSSQPVGLMVEPTDVCNLNCTGCWTNDRAHQGEQRYLSVEGFKKIIDDLGDSLFIIWLWGWGEPFLNKNIYEMIRYARKKDIVVISSTNGNLTLDHQEIDELLASDLSKLIVAVDGIDQETYGVFRVNGKLELVLENIRKIVDAKKRLGSITPLINMRMVVMRHNQGQISQFRSLAKSLGVDIASFKTMCSYRREGVNALFPTISEYQRYGMDEKSERVIETKQKYYCNRPWRRLHVFTDGSVCPCEFDFKREFVLGSVYDDRDLKELWNIPKARAFRKQFLTDINSISFCSNCPYKSQVVWDPTVECINLSQAASA